MYWVRKAKENGGPACISLDGISFVHVVEKVVVPSMQGKDKRKKSKAAAKLRPENVRICP